MDKQKANKFIELLIQEEVIQSKKEIQTSLGRDILTACSKDLINHTAEELLISTPSKKSWIK